jgi:antitoxin ParD1/3/4
MSSIDIFKEKTHHQESEILLEGTNVMASSLHVSLPDAMRQFVDQRTNGKKSYNTPSEYVRALIREDMEKDAEARYVYQELLKSAADIKAGRILSSAEVETHMDDFMEKLRTKVVE